MLSAAVGSCSPLAAGAKAGWERLTRYSRDKGVSRGKNGKRSLSG